MIRTNRGPTILRPASWQSKWRERNAFMMVGFAISLAAISVVFVLGCGAAPRSKYYELTVPSSAATAPATEIQLKLLIGHLSAAPIYREGGIVYSRGAQEVGIYQYQRWAEPPTEMIGEVLLRELRSSGHYLAVQPQRSNTSGDYLVHGRLHDFKEVDGSPTLARVTFDLEMRDLKTGVTLWTHSYTHDEPVSGNDVPAVVAALDRNVHLGVKEAVASLNQYFASHPAK